MFRRLSLSAALLVASISLCACPQSGHVWVTQRSPEQPITFRFGRRLGHVGGVAVGVFAVEPCGSGGPNHVFRPVWAIENENGSTEIDSVVYGIKPSFFSESHPPERLVPGCYHARISASPGFVDFDVAPDGSVRPHDDKP
jgi:hypothetical protein